MNISINKQKTATILAELKTIEELNKLTLSDFQKQYPNGIYTQDENGDEQFSTEAQEVFNDYYDHFLSVLEECKIENTQVSVREGTSDYFDVTC
jgi:hypothetical protein